MNISSEDFTELFNLIDSEYPGDHARISHYLYRAIYSMHFLNDGDIPRSEIKDICFTLFQLSECFYKAEEKRGLREQDRVRQVLAKARLLSDEPDPLAEGP